MTTPVKADPVYSDPATLVLLARIRSICARLPGTRETVSFGHPTFQTAAGKTFAVLETYKSELGLAIKVERALQTVFLKDSRFYLTPYIGKHGWVTLRMNIKLDWKEIRGILKGSYGLVIGETKRAPVKRKKS